MELLKNTWKNKSLVLMALPAVIIFFLFNYVPMFGLVLAFKDFNYADGIWNSPWNGFENFRFLFIGGTAGRLVRNTVGYFVIFTILGTIGNLAIAIGIKEMVFKPLAKAFQSAMILPTFISYVAVSFVVYALLKSNTGVINRLIISLGGENIQFYMKAEYWPFILSIVNTWKNIGYGSVIYLSVLMGIDPNLYEAADIDGASSFQKMKSITLPLLVPTVVVMTLLNLGSIMHSDTGLFYQVTKNIGLLYPTTQVLDSYVLNALSNGVDFGLTAAATFFQSVVGLFMVLITNLIVRKVSPENAIF